MQDKQHLAHAKHNESVCNYLSKKDIYSDWIITTAFYSALHFVRYLMIPAEVNGNTVTKFEPFYKKSRYADEGRHEFQVRYVLQYHNTISADYRTLRDLSNNARYLNYQHSRDESKLAKSSLTAVKEYTIKTKP